MSQGYHNRKTDQRELIPRFLIVCGGEVTEPIYFKSFPVRTRPTVLNLDVIPLKKDPVAVVRKAIHYRKQKPYEQVWCVFDRDETTSNDFNEAINLANQHNIQVAYSNEAFELWYLLHFGYLDSAVSRHDCCQKLTERLGTLYLKNDEKMYERLKSRQPQAIQHAKRLLAQYTPPNPVQDNSSTTVHRLVEALNQYIR